MLTIGLTGGLACGKSTVARRLEENGCALVHADLLGHEAIAPGGPAHAAVLAEFGQDLGDAGGQIDRRRLAERVFDQPDRVQKLNELVHPHIRRRIREHIDSFRRAHPDGILVVEAALLLEAFADPAIDKIVVIDCTEEQQVARFGQKGGTAEEARRRMTAQMPRAERLARADYIIDASGNIDETLRQVDRLYEQLRDLRPDT